MSYPDRSFSGSFDLLADGSETHGNGRVGWSAYESIEVQFNAGASFEDSKQIWTRIQLNTPFEGWHTNGIRAGFFYENSLLLANGSITWAETQNVALGLISNYGVTDTNELKCEFKLELNSTIKDVPTASAYLKHNYNGKRVDTDVHIKHIPLDETPNIFSLRSGWQLDTDLHYQNITGSVVLRSPLQGYRTGALSTKFSIGNNKQMRGGADLDLEEKKYTLLLDGYAKKMTDNMFVANITTPHEKFREIFGRFGVNERRKHIVAEVRAPHSALGFEALWTVAAISDFDVKLNVETPLEAFQQFMVVGKMKPETVEFIGAFNKAKLGYVGVWRMVNITDFEYSYKVYTPIEHYTENGFVVKFVRRDEFDLELSLQFSKHKVRFHLFF